MKRQIVCQLVKGQIVFQTTNYLLNNRFLEHDNKLLGPVESYEWLLQYGRISWETSPTTINNSSCIDYVVQVVLQQLSMLAWFTLFSQVQVFFLFN